MPSLALQTSTAASAESRTPLPLFTLASATKKTQPTENARNSQGPVNVAGAYTLDSHWRNRAELFSGREKIIEFLIRNWGVAGVCRRWHDSAAHRRHQRQTAAESGREFR